ncbi:Telomeric repeat-binding factor 2-interacting protein 1 [Pleurostoma richardsiae]|uniref:DNA-binding protein RAP1 n=1 Tax=Pleurostoma richardsiae TaxID=41990 RepID=A0AA38VBG1_9PEZI|nr:Telomeric repeat-binding factor 2-interacting protein 1 [Pleurostoma richardsiae]
MPAPIVYDGVEGSAGGSLFRGLKFWIAQRVPQRNDLVNKVKSNGGEVVPLEKQADMLIADHVRKDVPAGSYSWRFITNSVSKGQLEDKEPHQIGHLAASARPVGSSAPSKGTRNPFTSHDDALLTKWVLEHERKGAMAKGNTIYQDLELKYPHHTWQSWRDRWVRKLSLLPRPNLPEATSDDVEAPAPPPPSAVAPQRTASRAAVQRQPHYPQPSQGSPRVKFTGEDDQLLLDYVQEARRNGKSVKGNKIYEELAEEHPHHSYHSWRDRYVRILSRDEIEPFAPAVLEQPRPRANGRPQPSTNTTSTAPPSAVLEQPRPPSNATSAAPTKSTPDPGVSGASRTSSVVGHVSSNQLSPASVDLREIKERAKRQKINRQRRIAAKVIQRHWRGYRVRRDLNFIAFQAAARGFLTRHALFGSDDESEDNGEVQIKEESPDVRALSLASTVLGGTAAKPPTVKEQFYKDLQAYIYATGEEIALFPKVNGRVVDLWDLWNTITQQNMEPDDRDWEEIAEKLGFNWVDSPDVTRQLKDVYESTLGNFEREIEAFGREEESGDSDEDGEARGDEDSPSEITDIDVPRPDTDVVQESSQPHNSETNIPSSPPLPRGLKRSAQIDLPSVDLGFSSEPVRKRRLRFSRESEIPSTPDRRASLALRADRYVSPGLGTTSSPSNSRPSAARKARFIEPETQDFGYGHDENKDTEFLRESQYDVTPSQQLRSESDAVTPIPLSLPRLPSKASTGTRRINSGASSSTPRAVVANTQALRSLGTSAHRRHTGPQDGSLASKADTSSTAPRRSMPITSTKAGGNQTLKVDTQTTSGEPSSRNTGTVLSRVRPPIAVSASHTATDATASANGSVAKQNHEEIPEEIVERYVSMGYETNDVITALKATNMQPGYPTSVVVQSLAEKKGIPSHHEGVWTERDDRGLKLVDEYAKSSAKGKRKEGEETREERLRRAKAERERARLEHKHGLDRMEARRGWFELYRPAM